MELTAYATLRPVRRSMGAYLASAARSDADNEYEMIDSTIVRARQHSAGAQKKLGAIKLSVAPEEV